VDFNQYTLMCNQSFINKFLLVLNNIIAHLHFVTVIIIIFINVRHKLLQDELSK